MKQYLRYIGDDAGKPTTVGAATPTATALAYSQAKTAKLLNGTLPYHVDIAVNSTPRMNRGGKSSESDTNYHSQSLTRSTSKIVLTQRDEEPGSAGNINESVSSPISAGAKGEHLREHFKQSFQPISTQSVSSLEFNLRSTPSNAFAQSRPLGFDSNTRNHVFISDPIQINQSSFTSTSVSNTPTISNTFNNSTNNNTNNSTNNNNISNNNNNNFSNNNSNNININSSINKYSNSFNSGTPTITSLNSSRNRNLYSIPLAGVADQQQSILKTQGTREISRRQSISEELNPFLRQTKDEPLTPSSYSLIASNYLASRAAKSIAATPVNKSYNGGFPSSSLNSSPVSTRQEEPLKTIDRNANDLATPQLPKEEKTKKEIIEQSLAEVLAAIGKLQTNIQPVLEENPDDEVEVQRNKYEESHQAFLQSEKDRNDLSEQLTSLSSKVASLIGISSAIIPLSNSQLVSHLEETLKEKDRRIAELEMKVKQNQEAEAERETVTLKKQLGSSSNIDPYGSSTFGGGINNKPPQSYSLNNSPALRTKYRPTPLGTQVMNTPSYYGIGIKENEFPVSVSTSGGYNVFKAKIDHLNSLRDDRVLTALRK